MGKSLLDVVHPDYRELVIKRASQTHQGMTTSIQEEKFIRLDGQVIDVEVVAIPIKFQGKPATQVGGGGHYREKAADRRTAGQRGTLEVGLGGRRLGNLGMAR